MGTPQAPLNRAQLKPSAVAGLIRLGKASDGGYVVPEEAVRRSRVLLSLGIADDWSFERAFLHLNPAVRIVGVDDSVGPRWFAREAGASLIRTAGSVVRGNIRHARKHAAVMRNAVGYFSFFRPPHRHVRRRVAGRESATDVTLPSLLAASGAGDGHDVFLKIDIDGGEYGLVDDILRAAPAVNALVMEWHGLGRRTAAFNDAVSRLLGPFRLVHIHGNNYSPFDARMDFPDAVEMTFLHRALSPEPGAAPVAHYPRPDLDRPNKPSQPDHPLRFE